MRKLFYYGAAAALLVPILAYAATEDDLGVRGNLFVVGTSNLRGNVTIEGTATVAGATTNTALTSFTTGIAIGADPADAGAIRLSNAGYILSEADAAGTDISVIGVTSGEIVSIGASGASGVLITPATTISGLISATTGIEIGADPADAGVIRLPNAGYILSEADAAGTDISVIGVDSGELIQIGASGSSGVTITPATAVTGVLSANGGVKVTGHVTAKGTAPTASAGTIDTKSTDHAGRITGISATSTIVTFASAYVATPACVVTASDEPVWVVGASTTGFTPTAAAAMDDLSYVCFEIE